MESLYIEQEGRPVSHFVAFVSGHEVVELAFLKSRGGVKEKLHVEQPIKGRMGVSQASLREELVMPIEDVKTVWVTPLIISSSLHLAQNGHGWTKTQET